MIQTAAEPPYQGRISLAMRGWTKKSKKAPRNIVAAYSAREVAPRVRSKAAGTSSAVVVSGRWLGIRVCLPMRALLTLLDGLD